ATSASLMNESQWLSPVFQLQMSAVPVPTGDKSAWGTALHCVSTPGKPSLGRIYGAFSYRRHQQPSAGRLQSVPREVRQHVSVVVSVIGAVDLGSLLLAREVGVATFSFRAVCLRGDVP